MGAKWADTDIWEAKALLAWRIWFVGGGNNRLLISELQKQEWNDVESLIGKTK